ncbi:MAG: DUF1573 domain-containing protein [Candidatus Omnitrophota bacterium]|nr:MAG: DUF1573 domain-containing protein [Candidatus Omnitrophota bacterium]
MNIVLRCTQGILLLLFVAGCAMVTQQEITQAVPGMALDPFFWDFGKVEKGKTVVHTFILKNNAPHSLSVKTVNTSCGCAVTKIGEKSIPPGESTSLEVAFDSRDYSGVVQQYIYVHTDDLDNPILRFIIKADVV